jgi:hypothetical protein
MNRFSTHRLRFAFAVAVTAVIGTALASAGLAGMRTLGPAAASQYPGKKVTLCHRTHSKKHPWVKIRVSRKAMKAHLRHGDFAVDDQHPCPPRSAAAKTKHKNKHNGKGKGKGKVKGHQKQKSQSPGKKKDAAAAAKPGKGSDKSGGNGRGHGKK